MWRNNKNLDSVFEEARNSLLAYSSPSKTTLTRLCVSSLLPPPYTRVDKGSPAEQSGLKPGDQIVGVNGHSFLSIFHHEAVKVLKTYTTLVMTIRVS